MECINTTLDGVVILKPPTRFEDFRGTYTEIYNKRIYREAGISVDFKQDDISTSRRGVLRGIHGDNKTWKLISCLHGSFYIIVVNNDPKSSQYQKWEGFTLSDRNRLQILVPPKFGNGHQILTEIAIFHYKQSTEYNRDAQFTITWNNSLYDFWWPIKNPILSQRDEFGD